MSQGVAEIYDKTGFGKSHMWDLVKSQQVSDNSALIVHLIQPLEGVSEVRPFGF